MKTNWNTKQVYIKAIINIPCTQENILYQNMKLYNDKKEEIMI